MADSPELSRDELLELYKIAIDEYRFQVNLNWNRTQYYFILNVAIVAAATGILQLGAMSGPARVFVAALYAAGFVSCILALAAGRTQQSYYRSARSHKRRLEIRLGLGEWIVATTPGMGGRLSRLGRVTTFNFFLLLVLAAINLFGVALTLGNPKPSPVKTVAPPSEANLTIPSSTSTSAPSPPGTAPPLPAVVRPQT